MSILSTLFGNYGDDLIRAAGNYGDDAVKAVAKKAAEKSAKQVAKQTAKAGKSTVAQQIAKNEFDDYLTSLGASKTLRQKMAKSTYAGALGKTPMAKRFQTLGVDLANVADKSAAGVNAYGNVLGDLFSYMDNAGVGVDMTDLAKTANKLFTKTQKNRLIQSGLDIDDILKGKISAKDANEWYKVARDLGGKFSKSTDATQTILGDNLSKFSKQLRDKLDDTASTVSNSFGLKQKLIDAADSIGDFEAARAYAGMTDDAVKASLARAEMAPYMEMKDFIGLQAPAEKTLNVLGVDTGIANPLPKAAKAVQKGALKAKGALSSDSGKTAAIALGAGGLGLLGGLLAGSGNGGGQSMTALNALTSDSDAFYGGNGMNTQLGAQNATTGALGGNSGNFGGGYNEPTLNGYTYADLENAYVNAIMAGDSGAAGVIEDMIGMLDAKMKRQSEMAKNSGGNGEIGQKQQAAINVLNTLMGNFQAQGPIGGTFTNILNGLTGGNYDYRAANYAEQAGGSLSMIIKSLGESGALAEGDVKRAMGLIPQITDSPQKAMDKYQNLMAMLQAAGKAG